MPAPQKPATTPSLPGKLSTRTDGGPASKQAVKRMTGMAYGQNQDFENTEASAPMAKATPVQAMTPSAIAGAAAKAATPAGPAGAMGAGGMALPSLTGPSQRPNEPVTTPAPQKPSVDPRIAENATLVQRYMPDLLAATSIPGAPDSYRQFVNYLARQAAPVLNAQAAPIQ